MIGPVNRIGKGGSGPEGAPAKAGRDLVGDAAGGGGGSGGV